MVEVDRVGIARTTAALGGEGTTVVTLRTTSRYAAATLDAALPPDVGDGPANGGWFSGPSGAWLLLVEGLDAQVVPWLDTLAAALSAASVEGTLTGAGSVGPPRWAQLVARDARPLSASIGFRPAAPPGSAPARGWAAGPVAKEHAVEAGMRWLSQHEGDVMAMTARGANFWMPAPAAATLLTGDLDRGGAGVCGSFDRRREDIRHVLVGAPGTMTLTSERAGHPWSETVAELRSALLALPLDLVSTAYLSHRDLGTVLNADLPGSAGYDRETYAEHPELWDQFVLEPSGVQVLTDRHLARAHDLSSWRTTRLDTGHVLVEAADLDPWFATPRRSFEAVGAELLAQARRDFGAMILTAERSQELGR